MKAVVLVGLGAISIGGQSFAGGVPHIGDIGVKFEGGRIVTTIVEEDELRDGELGELQRVFDSDLGTVEFGPFGNDEPGYTSNVLPLGASIGFNIRGELKKWNGTTFVGGIDETMQFGKFLGTPGEITRDTAGGFVAGFDFATADEVGFIDEHLSQILRGPDTTRGFADPADGIYLIEMEVTTDVPGILPSEPYYIVYNLNNDQSVQDEAISYVETVIIPAPGVTALLGLIAVPAVRRRRS
jgi:hypothetical protein